MFYFAYGSNMCTGRLRQRVSSANPVRVAKLLNHSLRFHKRSDDHSGKCDAYFTGERQDVIWGVVFEINPAEKPYLDKHEGLGHGYVEKLATVIDTESNRCAVFMYVADNAHIDPMLRPYSWYKQFVVEGARQHQLPADYVDAIRCLEEIEDSDRVRDTRNRSILC
jgi:cation transport regulator ChaC